MIHELRIYRAMPGKFPALHERFQAHTLRLLDKNGIRPIAFWTVLIGGTSQDLYWLIEWKDLAERDACWSALAADPEWTAVKAETEREGALIEHQTNLMLAPTAYSPMRRGADA